MVQNSPIYLVDDDMDDQGFLKDILVDLKIENPLLFFNTGKEVLEFLKTTKEPPFIILCDVNIPVMDGFELRKELLADEKLAWKSIPFIFWSTAATNNQIKKAYDLAVHGFFIKGTNYGELSSSLNNIINYWKDSKQPEL